MLGLADEKRTPMTQQHSAQSGKVQIRKEVLGMWTDLLHVAEVVLRIPKVYVAESLL
jgi:hypothetical protein